jgi:uncharacterized cupin superfamily protein
MIGGMRRINVNTVELEYDDTDPEGYRAGSRKVSQDIGAVTMAGSVYEVPPGQANCPYHYESDEEWLLVLAGTLTVRHPGGDDELEAGDLVCFPRGPDGAHKLSNNGTDTVRMFIVSTRNMPQVAVYPDSDKIGIWTEDGRDNIMVRRESAVGYYDGET